MGTIGSASSARNAMSFCKAKQPRKKRAFVSADARLEASESRSQQLEESSTMRQADLDAAPERIDVVDTAMSEH